MWSCRRRCVLEEVKDVKIWRCRRWRSRMAIGERNPPACRILSAMPRDPQDPGDDLEPRFCRFRAFQGHCSQWAASETIMQP